MSDIDPEKLDESIKWARHIAACNHDTENLTRLADAAEVTLAALPRYEEVDVWRVEWAAAGGIPCIDQHTDKSFVEQVAEEKRNLGRQCIRVTGPHKQRVPA